MPDRRTITDPRRVAVAGASGLVGREIALRVAADPSCMQLHLVLRKPLPAFESMLRVQAHRIGPAGMPLLPPVDEALCALGTTIKVAGSQAAFRAVDFDAVVHFARRAREAGATRFAVVSALGANQRSSNFYLRVKGEAEAALKTLGFDTLVIAQPSLLVGDRAALGQPPRLGERVTETLTRPLWPLIPPKWRPIEAAVVAKAMLAALKAGTRGVQVLDSAALQQLGR